MKPMPLTHVVVAALLVGCSGSSEVPRTAAPAPSATAPATTVICAEPQNPYSGGGRASGFDWARQSGRKNCEGYSDAFIEGCAAYWIALQQFETCVGRGFPVNRKEPGKNSLLAPSIST
jgi:hypothetical protein